MDGIFVHKEEMNEREKSVPEAVDLFERIRQPKVERKNYYIPQLRELR